MSKLKLIEFLSSAYHLHSTEFLYVDKDYNWKIHRFKVDIPNFKCCGNLSWLKDTEYRTFVLRDFLSQFSFRPGYAILPILEKYTLVNIEGFITVYAQGRLDSPMEKFINRKVDDFMYPNRVCKVIHFVNNIYG